jgi:hypothetical protein
MSRHFVSRWIALPVLGLAACSGPGAGAQERPVPEAGAARWIAGDHHVHSRYSVGWDSSKTPPSPILGGDAVYPIPMNALMGRHYGLGWMVATDHGGPNHSKVNLERAWPELNYAREVVPEVLQFYGMELDTPGADHSSIILPHDHDEAAHLHEVESRFAKYEPWPRDTTWDRPSRMLEALAVMREFARRPVVIAHHPSRSGAAPGQYGLTTPAELRDWNDVAPEVAVGMEGAPGHQAMAIRPDGSLNQTRSRGYYLSAPTRGGFDQMTAVVGGFWDAMLGEGRHWWITANSDSHQNWREGGADFWPGEYSKTWVWAAPTHDAVLEGLRGGQVFVSLGDLVTGLFVTVRGGGAEAGIGGTLEVPGGSPVEVEIRWLDPGTPNSHGDNPAVARVDLIVGQVTGPVSDRTSDTNPTARVVARFDSRQWRQDGAWRTATWRLDRLQGNSYFRVRGTNGTEEEPALDPPGEDPWSDLWFYSNPVFVKVR